MSMIEIDEEELNTLKAQAQQSTALSEKIDKMQEKLDKYYQDKTIVKTPTNEVDLFDKYCQEKYK